MVRAIAFLIPLMCGGYALAQNPCQEYRLVYETVYDQKEVTAFRIETETVFHEQKQTAYRPVMETEMRERRYTVARPVTETSEREERYRVQRPVWETQVRDTSYDVVRQVAETSEREERFTVQRPVMETQEREERFVVQRPVIETQEREEAFTVNEPVTTWTTNYVDQGQFVDQINVTPGPTRNLNRWLPLVKWLAAVPHYVVLFFLYIAAFVVVVSAWFAIVFTGTYPRGMFRFIEGVFRWTSRVTAYAFTLVTDEYPPFRLAR